MAININGSESQGATPTLSLAGENDRPDARSNTATGDTRKAPARRGADYYDTVLWRVLPRDGADMRGYSIGLTSSERRAGVSTVAANLAIRAADHRLSPVLLLDANLTRPSLHRSFRLRNAAGLTEVLADDHDPRDAIHETNVDGLSVMPLGDQRLVDRARVDQQGIVALMTELRAEFSTVIVDLPEVRELRHSLLLAQQLDATLMVVRCNGTTRQAAQNAIHRLDGDGIKVVGSVMTQHKTYTPRWLQRWL